MQAGKFYEVALLLISVTISSIFSANVGNTTVYTTTNTSTSRQAHQFTMPENGQITSISMYHNAASSSYQTQFGIYSNGTNNLPSSKLAATAKTAMKTTEGWQTINLSAPVNVTAGTKIWIAWMYQNANGPRRTGTVSGSPGYVTGSGTWSTTGDNMPTTFVYSSTTAGINFSVYATYTPTYTLTTSVYPTGSGTVTRSPDKTSYNSGEVVRLTPAGGTGYAFSSWSGDASGNASYIDVTMNSNKNITANFVSVPTYTLTTTVIPTGAGTITRSPDKTVYNSGDVVRLTPVAGTGYFFTSWSGDASGNAGYIDVTMSSNKNITASFGQIKTVGNTTVYTGTNTSVSRMAHQFTMPENGQISSISMYHNAASSSYQTQFGIYANGTNNLPGSLMAPTSKTAKTAMKTTAGWQTINLTAPITVAAGTKIWVAWMYQNANGPRRTGAVSGSPGYVTGSGTWSTTGDNMPTSFGSATTTAGTNFSVYATYTPTYTLTTTVSPTGSGTVTRSPDKTSYTSGEVVRLTAAGGIGYDFSSWSGSASGSTTYIDVTMDANKSVTANFIIKKYSITITAVNGNVTKSPNQTQYDSNSVVTLTAVPSIGYHFTGWSGDLTGSTNPAQITMNSLKSVSANFAINTYSLTVQAVNGSITKTPDQTLYDSNSVVTLTATPTAGYMFTRWSGDAEGSVNPLAVTMNKNTTITANFVATYTLTTNVYPTGSGTITRSPDKTSYTSGEVVRLTPNAESGYAFSNWDGDTSGNANPLDFIINSNNLTITANFVQNSFYISDTGNDSSGDGSFSSPWQTITKARDYISTINSNMTCDIIVYLRGGTYNLNSTIVFDQNDGGTNGHFITYKSYNNEEVKISGGKKVTTSWTLHSNGIYKTGIEPGYFRQLYVDGGRAIRARTPNRTSNTTFGPYYTMYRWINWIWDFQNSWGKVDTTLPDSIFEINATDINPEWDGIHNDFNAVEIVLKKKWDQSRLRIDSTILDSQFCYIKLKDGDVRHRMRDNNQYYFFENSIDFLDTINEWFLDVYDNYSLYYKPIDSKDPNTSEIIIPVVERLIDIKYLEHLKFEGIIFENTTWNMPDGQRNGAQFGIRDWSGSGVGPEHDCIPSAIEINFSNFVQFSNNTFRNLGGAAIELYKGANNILINSNVIYNISGNGITIHGEIGVGAGFEAQYCKNDTISNNTIYKIGQDYYGSCGVTAIYPINIAIENNEIFDSPYTGISLGYCGWDTNPHSLQDNKIRYNDIHHVMQVNCDGSGIYTMGSQPNSQIYKNWIHDIQKSPFAEDNQLISYNGIYLDEGTSHFTNIDWNELDNVHNFYFVKFPNLQYFDPLQNDFGLETTKMKCGPIQYNKTLGENIAEGKPVYVSDTYSGTLAEWANDGKINTIWHSDGNFNTTKWLKIDLGVATQISKIEIVDRPNTFYATTREDFEIQASNDFDFTTYKILAYHGDLPYPEAGTIKFRISDNSRYQFVRVKKTKTPDNLCIAEIRIFDTTKTQDDTIAPTPNPMTWANGPRPLPLNLKTIVMDATPASDVSGVKYDFYNITLIGHNSRQNTTHFEDTGLIPGTTYSYKVMARDKSPNLNVTEYSEILSATTFPDTIPPPKPIISINKVYSNKVDVSWTRSDDNYRIANYVVEFRPSDSQTYTTAGTVDGTTLSFVVKFLKPNQTYYFRIIAIDGVDNFTISDESSAKTKTDITPIINLLLGD